jgi:RNA polymerase sigma-70 factor (ECF subfamily)
VAVPEPPSTPELARQLQAGDAQAAQQVFYRYAQRLAHLAEKHLSRKLAGRLDGEDVVQSVFRTFFRRSAGGEFVIDSSAQLWRLLVKITLLKVQAKARQHRAAMRDVGVEAPAGQAWLLAAQARDPGPEEAAALVDQIEAIVRGLPASYAQILEMRLHGRPVAEIAEGLGLSRQSVYRALNLLQQRLAASEGPSPA